MLPWQGWVKREEGFNLRSGLCCLSSPVHVDERPVLSSHGPDERLILHLSAEEEDPGTNDVTIILGYLWRSAS